MQTSLRNVKQYILWNNSVWQCLHRNISFNDHSYFDRMYPVRCNNLLANCFLPFVGVPSCRLALSIGCIVYQSYYLLFQSNVRIFFSSLSKAWWFFLLFWFPHPYQSWAPQYKWRNFDWAKTPLFLSTPTFQSWLPPYNWNNLD